MAGGRPTDYNTETTSALCAELVLGRSLRSICGDENMPAIATVYVWLSKHPEFVEQYARAREDQADTMADEIVDIADGCKFAEDNAVMTARDRLRVDARKWVASKLKPKRYGDKVTQEHTGPTGGPVELSVTMEAGEAYRRMLDAG